MHTLLFFAFLNSFILSPNSVSTHGQIKVKVTNIEDIEGDILIGVFHDPEVFLERGKFLKGEIFPVKQLNSQEFIMTDIPFGTYAVAVYHDKNSNTYLDKNFFGVPKEPYGFYKHVRAKWSEPQFSEASFEFNEDNMMVEVELKYWANR